MMKNFILTALFFFTALASSNAQSNLDLDPCLLPFYHGVASGDPLTDRVIIWTRVTPANLGADPVSVQWKIATDTTLSRIKTRIILLKLMLISLLQTSIITINLKLLIRKVQ
jgi:phosphodiesterase/alkaline phosphatase D-like protein